MKQKRVVKQALNRSGVASVIVISLFLGLTPTCGVAVTRDDSLIALEGTDGDTESVETNRLMLPGTNAVNASSREFIRDWLMCGPFPNPLPSDALNTGRAEPGIGFGTDYLQSVGGEKAIQPREGLEVAFGENERRRWWLYSSPNDHIDLLQAYGENSYTEKQDVTAYAACWINSPNSQRVLLAVGSDDGVRIWHNGKSLWTHHVTRGAHPDEDWMVLDLRAGQNFLLFKIAQGSGTWGLYARLLDLEERRAELLKVETDPLDVKMRRAPQELCVSIAPTSRFLVLEQEIPCRLTLLNEERDRVKSFESYYGGSVTIPLAGLRDSWYWLQVQAELPSGVEIMKEVNFHLGEPRIRASFLAADGAPVPIQQLEPSELLDNSWEPVEGAIRLKGDGEIEVLRNHISPFRLRVLAKARGLGMHWRLADDGGRGFTPPKGDKNLHIDLNLECARTAVAKAQEATRRASGSSAWLKQMLGTRAQMADKVFRQASTISDPRKRAEALERVFDVLRPGCALQDTAQATVWYAPGTYKIGLEEALPAIPAENAWVSLARNEYESFQVVLRPHKPLKDVRVEVSDLIDDKGTVLPAQHIDIRQVQYVSIEEPSDFFGEKNGYPDPLVAVTSPLYKPDLPSGRNAPFWFTVHAPAQQEAGEYRGSVRLFAEDREIANVPLLVNVYSFALPDTTHTDSAYGLSPMQWSYHGPLSEAQKREVHERYMQICAAHRISPYDPMELDRIRWQVVEKGGAQHIELEFSDFDAAAERYLDGMRFTSFNLAHHIGISRQLPTELGGHERGTSEYTRLFKELAGGVQEHLREKGWLEKAYVYWIDEPHFEIVYGGVKVQRVAAQKCGTC